MFKVQHFLLRRSFTKKITIFSNLNYFFWETLLNMWSWNLFFFFSLRTLECIWVLNTQDITCVRGCAFVSIMSMYNVRVYNNFLTLAFKRYSSFVKRALFFSWNNVPWLVSIYKVRRIGQKLKHLNYTEVSVWNSKNHIIYRLHRSANNKVFICCWKTKDRFRGNFWRRIWIQNQNQPITSGFWDIWGYVLKKWGFSLLLS